LRTLEVSKLLIQEDPSYFRFFCHLFENEEFCNFIVTANGKLFQYVPQKLKTLKLCETAILNNCNAIKHVTPKFLSSYSWPQILNLMLRSQAGGCLRDYPKLVALITPSIINKILVGTNHDLLGSIPENMVSDEVYSLFITANAINILKIPQSRRTKSMYLCAILNGYGEARDNFLEKDGVLLELLDPLVSYFLVNKNLNFFEKIPIRHRYQHICEYVLTTTTYGGYLRYVPENFRTLELCKLVIPKFPKDSKWIPPDLLLDLVLHYHDSLG